MINFDEMRRTVLLIEKERDALKNLLSEYVSSKSRKNKKEAVSTGKNLTYFIKNLVEISNNGGLLLKVEQDSFKKLINEILQNKNLDDVIKCYENSSFENQKKIESIVGFFVFEKLNNFSLKKDSDDYFSDKVNLDFIKKTIDFFKEKKEFCHVFKSELNYFNCSEKDFLPLEKRNSVFSKNLAVEQSIYFTEENSVIDYRVYLHYNKPWILFWENLNYFFKDEVFFNTLLSSNFKDPFIEQLKNKKHFYSDNLIENAVYFLKTVKKGGFNASVYKIFSLNNSLKLLNFIKKYPKITNEESRELFNLIDNTKNLTKEEDYTFNEQNFSFNHNSLFLSYVLLDEDETKKFNESMSHTALQSIIIGFFGLYKKSFMSKNNLNDIDFELVEELKKNNIFDIFFNKLSDNPNLKIELISRLCIELKEIKNKERDGDKNRDRDKEKYKKDIEIIEIIKRKLQGNANILENLVSCCSVNGVKEIFNAVEKEAKTNFNKDIANVIKKIKSLKIEEIGDLFYPHKVKDDFNKRSFVKSCSLIIPPVYQFTTYNEDDKEYFKNFIDFFVDENIKHIENPFYWFLTLLKEENVRKFLGNGSDIELKNSFNLFSEEEMDSIMLKRSMFYVSKEKENEPKKILRF